VARLPAVAGIVEPGGRVEERVVDHAQAGLEEPVNAT
jgi:hypothetical protein